MTGLAIAVRFIHLVASTQLVGTFTFLLVVARPACRKAGLAADPAAERFDRRLLRISRWALVVTAVTTLAALGLQAASVTGSAGAALSLSVLDRLATGTQYGRVAVARLAGLILLGGLLLVRQADRDRKGWWTLRIPAGLLAAIAMAALAWIGHAVTIEGWGAWPLVADAVHLLATGVWVGGLVPLAQLLAWTLREPSEGAARVAQEATRRFSALAFCSVTLLALTGVFNGWVQVREVPPLVGTPYGRLLLVKLAFFAPLIGIAAVNLARVKPRLLAVNSGEQLRRHSARLRRNVFLEAGLGLAILLVVAGLGVTPPARHMVPHWPFSVRFAWQARQELPAVRTRVAIGSAAAAVGLATALVGMIVRPRRWVWVAGTGLGATALGLAVGLPPLAIDAYPTTYVRPTVPYTANSIAYGLRLYREHCAVCHGVAGYGDGPAAAGLSPSPADLTAQHAADHTVGDLFWWLTHGIKGSAMPGFGDRLSEEDRWDLINFMRTLAAAEQARGLGPLVAPAPAVVAPDFAFTTGGGEPRSLKDFRGRAVVLLVLFDLPKSAHRLGQLMDAHPMLQRLGSEILAVPARNAVAVHRELEAHPVFSMIVVDGAAEAAATYALFGRDLSAEGQGSVLPASRHVELLVDRQGYVRARWIPDHGAGWADPKRLIAEVERLAEEPPRAPAPDEHVH